MAEAKRWFILLGIIILGSLVYLLSSVMTPFVIAAFLAYLTDPMVNHMQAWKVPRTLATILVFVILGIILMILLLIIVPMLEQQIVLMINTIPAIINWAQTDVVPWLNKKFGVTHLINITWIKQNITNNLSGAGSIATSVLRTISHSGMTVFSWLVNLILIPVVMFYLLRDWDLLENGCHKLMPRSIEPVAVKLLKQCDEVLSAFIRGQLMVMLCLGILYSVGMSIVGLDLALLIGMIAGIVSIVPYLGFIIGITSATIAALVQFHDWLHVIGIWVVFAVAQTIEATTLTPWLVGDKIGLHPVAVIFAILAGGELFGFVGILLALPVSAVIMVFIRYFTGRYVQSNLYSKQPV